MAALARRTGAGGWAGDRPSPRPPRRLRSQAQLPCPVPAPCLLRSWRVMNLYTEIYQAAPAYGVAQVRPLAAWLWGLAAGRRICVCGCLWCWLWCRTAPDLCPRAAPPSHPLLPLQPYLVSDVYRF